MIIAYTNRRHITAIVPDNDSALISITTSDGDWPAVEGWRNILQLKFDDIDEEAKGRVLFNEEMAKAIIDFVERTAPSRLFINCDAGMSRSAGVAAALYEIFEKRRIANAYPFHNRHVARVLLNVAHERSNS